MRQVLRRVHTWMNRPVFLAFFLQLSVLVLQFVFWRLFVHWSHEWRLTWTVVLVVQSVLTALLSWWCGMDIWWWGIQALLPFAVVWALHLPPIWFAVGFVALVPMYWHTFKTRVPYYPSDRAMWLQLVEWLTQHHVAAGHSCRVIDIGSGLGGMVLHLAAEFPACEIVGVELSPLPWGWSYLRAKWSHSRGRLLRGDYQRMDFADYDVVVAYLSPAAMPALWTKVKREMRAGSVLFSYGFEIPGQPASEIFHMQSMREPLYAWYI